MAPQPKTPDRDNQPINVRLPLDLHAELIERCRAEDRTMAQTIRVALRQYLRSAVR